MRRMRNTGRAALIGAGLAGLAACSSPSAPEQMTIAPTTSTATALTPTDKGYHSVTMTAVDGGAPTAVIGLSEVSNEALRSALISSLGNLGYMAPDRAAASYRLSADLMDLDRPNVAYDPVIVFVPIDMSVTVKIHYRVESIRTGQAVFDDVVATTGTATANDAITPTGRIQKANEAAVRLNIAAFLQRLQPSLN